MKNKATSPGKKTTRVEPAPTRLWLIRHAHAVEAAQDTVRPLSKRGRRQIRSLARLLGASDALRPDQIWHSPLVRSRQTAELLVRRLGLDAPLISMAGLMPDDAPPAIARRLKALRCNVAVVGHEPHLSALASLLVAGAAEPAIFILKKCAVLALERAGAHWVVRWQVSPEVLG